MAAEPCPTPTGPAYGWNDSTDLLLADCRARADQLHRRIERRAARHTLVAHAVACCGFVGGMLGSFLVVGAQGAVPPGVVCALSTVAAVCSAVSHTAVSPLARAARAEVHAGAVAALVLDMALVMAVPAELRCSDPAAVLRGFEARLGACRVAAGQLHAQEETPPPPPA